MQEEQIFDALNKLRGASLAEPMGSVDRVAPHTGRRTRQDSSADLVLYATYVLRAQIADDKDRQRHKFGADCKVNK